MDLDIKTRGIKIEKRSFMNLEVTLFIEKQFDVKSKTTKLLIREIIETIVETGLSDKNLFNFNKNKK